MQDDFDKEFRGRLWRMGRSPELLSRSRCLRKTQTLAEDVLWNCLRNRRLHGFKFRRQHSIGKFVLDFYCAEGDLAIEVDGCVHDDPEVRGRDWLRTEWLEQAGFRVLRVSNEEVLEDIDSVLLKIASMLQSEGPHPPGTLTPRPPLPLAGEGEKDPHPGPLPLAGEGEKERGERIGGEGFPPAPLPLAGEGESEHGERIGGEGFSRG